MLDEYTHDIYIWIGSNNLLFSRQKPVLLEFHVTYSDQYEIQKVQKCTKRSKLIHQQPAEKDYDAHIKQQIRI